MTAEGSGPRGGRGQRGRQGGRHGHGGRHGGAPFGRGGRARRGNVRAAVLVLLAEEPMHGYQLMQVLAERSGGAWNPSAGSIYPTLQQLTDEGLVRAEESEGRKVYSLTDAGQKYVDERGEQDVKPWEQSESAEGYAGLREAARHVMGAVRQVARVGDESQLERAKDVLVAARKQLYEILASDEPAK